MRESPMARKNRGMSMGVRYVPVFWVAVVAGAVLAGACTGPRSPRRLRFNLAVSIEAFGIGKSETAGPKFAHVYQYVACQDIVRLVPLGITY